MKRVIFLFFVVVTFAACRKNEFQSIQPEKISEKQVAKIEFARTLAKAIAKEPLLRSFIKSEALKQFDKDYDVLFNLVKDQIMEDGESVYEKIEKYASAKENLDKNLSMLPLLTIYVPVLPDFYAEKWDTNLEIPRVAVEPDKKNLLQKNVEIYDGDGTKINLESKYVPGFPVIVIKENERVTIQNAENPTSNKQFIQGSDLAVPFMKKNGLTYSFISEDFNGNIQARPTIASGIDAVNITAFNSGNEWQRDYVYYGITPTNQTGIFTNRFSEFIKSFKLINGNDHTLIGDHTNDPKINQAYNGKGFSSLPSVPWVEGNYEFRVSVLINAKNGVGQELRKIFTIRGSDLFSPQYQRVNVGGGFLNYHYFLLTSVVPKQVDMNLELIPWDLEQYGSAWKFIVSEYDPAEEITYQVTNTAVFGANFSFDPVLSGTVKGGAKFGASAQTTHSTVYTYKTTTGSDDLGEGILEFRSPIITSQNGTLYNTYEVTTGVVSFSVEPKRIY